MLDVNARSVTSNSNEFTAAVGSSVKIQNAECVTCWWASALMADVALIFIQWRTNAKVQSSSDLVECIIDLYIALAPS